MRATRGASEALLVVLVLTATACSSPPVAKPSASVTTRPATASTPSAAKPTPTTTAPRPGTPTTTAPYALLGLAYSSTATGFGTVEPATIANGADPAAQLTGIAWTSWGGDDATGVSTSHDVDADGTSSNGSGPSNKDESAEVIAYDLGFCPESIQLVYLGVRWFVGSAGQSAAKPGFAQSTCGPDHPTPPYP
jgi:hypothetical protein